MRVELVSIDPQNDFCSPDGSLFVEGGNEDMERLASFVNDIQPKLDGWSITLDQHHEVDISHGSWFADDNGDPAPPFTQMSYDETTGKFVGTLVNGSTKEFRTRKRAFHNHTRDYLNALTAGGRYPHVIWPTHCLIGSPGANVYPAVFEALTNWATLKTRTINFVAKGSNPFTEHFSAIQAEVPMPNDPSTQVNTGFLHTLERADLILLTGEALSHCVANTGRDLVANFSDPTTIKKIVLLTDTTSNVTSFEGLGDQFLTDMQNLGMRTMTCSEAKKMLV